MGAQMQQQQHNSVPRRESVDVSVRIAIVVEGSRVSTPKQQRFADVSFSELALNDKINILPNQIFGPKNLYSKQRNTQVGQIDYRT